MADMYVLEGPADCGNIFGYWRHGLIPAGRYAVVVDGDLANGGAVPVPWTDDYTVAVPRPRQRYAVARVGDDSENRESIRR